LHEPDLQRVHDGRMTPNAAYGARFSAFSACRDARARNTLAARGKLFRNTESRYQTPCWPKIGKWLQWLDRRSLKDYRKVPESRQGHTSTPGAPARRWANCPLNDGLHAYQLPQRTHHLSRQQDGVVQWYR